jgi:CheY-like chemotaxis protein
MTASDGETGLELIRSRQPDVILLDFIMESLYSGLEVCRQVRNDPSLNRTPIICISGMKKDLNLHFNQEEDAAYFDPDAYFDKPVDKELLVRTINSFLN